MLLKFFHKYQHIYIWASTNRNILLKYFLVIFALSFSAVLAPRAAMGNRIGLLAISAILVIFLFLLISKKPIIGLIFFTLGSVFTPFSWQGNFNFSQISIAGLLVIWILDMLIVKKHFFIVKSQVILPVIFFIIISLGSFLLGQVKWFTYVQNAPIEAQLGGLAINLLSVGAFLLVAHTIIEPRDLEILTWLFISIGIIYILGRFIRVGWIDSIFQWGFTRGSLFWTWLAALITGQLFGNKQLKFFIKGFLVICLLILFYVAAIQSQDWKSGWFPPLVGVVTIFVIKYWKRIRYFIPFLVIPLFFLINLSIGEEGWSWGTRLDAWVIVLNISMISPIFGLGFANYYWYTPLFPIRGYAVRFNSHSQFVDVIAQNGLLGLACLLWFFVEISLLSLRSLKVVQEGFAKGYIYGAIGGIAGTIIAAFLVDWLLPFTYNIGMAGFRASVFAWIFMGGVVCLDKFYGSQKAED